MAKRQKVKVTPKKKWRLREVIKDLEAHGAVEIPLEMLEKEPYKSYMKNVKRNGKFVCK